jgi:hypothetical protein
MQMDTECREVERWCGRRESASLKEAVVELRNLRLGKHHFGKNRGLAVLALFSDFFFIPTIACPFRS